MHSRATRPHDRAHDAALGYVYANQFEVGFSRDEVLLRLAQAYEGVGAQADQARIVMTPSYAKALLLLLGNAMARFETEFGEVTAAGAGIAASANQD